MGEPILVVDDDPAHLKRLRLALSAEGYVVATAADAHGAFRVLESMRPRLIVVDLALPEVDGFELTERIKADPRTSDVPVLALTQFAMKGDRDRALRVGCDEYISKPVDVVALPALVARMLAAASRV